MFRMCNTHFFQLKIRFVPRVVGLVFPLRFLGEMLPPPVLLRYRALEEREALHK